MKRIQLIIVVMMTVFTSVAPAQQGAEETDPFHPSGNRPVTSPAPSDDTWGRDPFTSPLAGKPSVSKAPERAGRGAGLTGIIYSADVRLAIINGEALREGSMVGDKKIVDIRKQSVVLLNSAGSQEEVVLEDFSLRK
jgi:hypothetical protein